MHSPTVQSNKEKPIHSLRREQNSAGRCRRTNQEWLNDLAGMNGPHIQEQAHQDLANYLFRVAVSYLDMRRESVSALYLLSDVELAEFAQDYVQETLEKLASNHFALLAKYSGTGRFTSWMAQVIRNEVAGELRRAAWQKRSIHDPADLLAGVAATTDSPERIAVEAQIGELLYSCLAQLPEHYRIAIWDRLVEGDSAEEVGGKLGVSANAVNLLVFRGKKKLRELLIEAGVDAEILSVFIPTPATATFLHDSYHTH